MCNHLQNQQASKQIISGILIDLKRRFVVLVYITCIIYCLSLSQPLLIVNNICSNTWWSSSACYKVMTKRIRSFLEARGFTNAVANLRQSKLTLYWIIFIYKLYFSYFHCCFCWSVTAELLRTQLSTGIATSSYNTGSVATIPEGCIGVRSDETCKLE